MKKLEKLKKNWLCLNHLREKNTGFQIVQIIFSDEIVDVGYGKIFFLLTTEKLLQMSFFEQMVDFDIFYRDWKKCFCPLRISLHDWQKI